MKRFCSFSFFAFSSMYLPGREKRRPFEFPEEAIKVELSTGKLLMHSMRMSPVWNWRFPQFCARSMRGTHTQAPPLGIVHAVRKRRLLRSDVPLPTRIIWIIFKKLSERFPTQSTATTVCEILRRICASTFLLRHIQKQNNKTVLILNYRSCFFAS